MSKIEIEVVVKLAIEKVVSYSSLFIRWHRTTGDPVVRLSAYESVFDQPESIVEVQVNDDANL